MTLDDGTLLAAAREDPIGFVERLDDRVVLDEIQRAPELILPLKTIIVRDRRPGRFILTGSANLLRMPTLSDSLAGRIEVLRLGPLAQTEIEGLALGETFLARLFGDDLLQRSLQHRTGDMLVRRVLAGGFPAAISRATHTRRARWLLEYADTFIEKDLREQFTIMSIPITSKASSWWTGCPPGTATV